jgi:hypothetical protein
MTCQEFWSRMRELPGLLPPAEGTHADSSLMEHVQACLSCTGLMEQQRALHAGLKRMAAEQAGLRAPAHVEATLLRHFRAGRAQHPGRAALAWLTAFRGRTLAAVLATAVLAVVLISYRGPLSRLLPSSTIEVEDAGYLDSGFVPLPSAGGGAPNTEAAVVRVEMPSSTLVALGVPVADQATGGTVEAELLLGPGGMPQAVRVIE